MSVDRLRRLPEFLGIGPASRTGKGALLAIANTLSHALSREQLPPITGSLGNPFDLDFEAQGPGVVFEPPCFRKSSVTIFHPNGDEYTYRTGGLGIVRRFEGSSSSPLSPNDADILEAVAKKTVTLKAERDEEARQAVLKKPVLQRVPFLHQAIVSRLAFRGVDHTWYLHHAAVNDALTIPFFNNEADPPYSVIFAGSISRANRDAIHTLGLVGKTGPTSADAFEFTIEKIGQLGDQPGEVTCQKKTLELPPGDFSQLSRDRLIGLLRSGKQCPYQETDQLFLDNVIKWIKYPITSEGQFGVTFSPESWTCLVSKQLSPGVTVKAQVKNPYREGTVFTIDETDQRTGISTTRPAAMGEIGTILASLVQAEPGIGANPWLDYEAAKIRTLLGESQITLRRLMVEGQGGQSHRYDLGVSNAVLSGMLGAVQEATEAAHLRRLLRPY